MSRRLPDWLIVGAMKSGTTSLAQWIAAHPQAWMGRKELHFFQSGAYDREGLDGYAAQFADAPPGALAGEATPLYLASPVAIGRIARDLPHAKLIACLREPGARAYSHWLHLRHRAATERRPFAAALDDYLPGGHYAEQLERLFAAVGRGRVHVVLTDDLAHDPAGAFAGVCRFLGIDDSVPPPPEALRANAHFRHRPLWLWRALVRHRALERLPGRAGEVIAVRLLRRRVEYPPLAGPLRERLDAYYAPHDARLAALLGRELPPGWPR